MARIKYKGVTIKAISACVPKNISKNSELGYLIPKEEIEKTINSIGIVEKRFVDEDTTASDLCFKAAKKLIEDNNIDRNSIDLVLFLSQLPDYKIPATAPILQHRLGLPTTTAALDLSLGCSGYVYALSTAMAYASMEGINRVLLLVGETFSKFVNKMDKVDAPLYGDAGTATLVDKSDTGFVSVFDLYSDGSGENAVKIKAGEGRHKTTVENLKEHTEKDGSILSDNEVFMNGMEVFNFVMRVVPKSIKTLCSENDIVLDQVGHLVLHQANKFMTDFVSKRIKYPLERVPYSLDKFGNTSSPSIPLTISSELSDAKLTDAVISGFGAGLSWGVAHINLSECKVSEIIDY
ncbi:MAG: ketoacyl-ACP synthase III [Paludibacteraceae bacterium]|nr:ketoacyl-ACP synthase III [Paludibacteraceae bacterium]